MYISGGGIKNDQKESDIIYAWSLTGVFLAPARKMFIFCLQFWIESKPYLPMCTVSTWHTFLMDGRTTVTFHPIFFGKPSKQQLTLITCQESFNAHWSKVWKDEYIIKILEPLESGLWMFYENVWYILGLAKDNLVWNVVQL